MITIDGWITIGTKLSTEKFDKQISDLEKKIDSEEKKQELLNNKTAEYTAELENANREVNELAKQYENAAAKAEQLRNALSNAPKGSFKSMQLSDEYSEQVKKVDELSSQLSKAENVQSRLKDKVTQTKLQYDNSVKSVDRLRGKIETVTLTKQNRDIKSMTDGIGGAIKKVGKLALAVLSVRSAYSLLRQASSTWAQYNEQYARDIEYIRFALASGLAPILEKIVQLVATLMQYVNYLTQAWFGKQIFASAKDFEKMSKNASGVAKSTKEIKNNLASFDELNILTKNASGGGGGFLSPSFDLANFEAEIPEWIKWLGDNGDTVKNTLIGIGAALGALKLSELATNLGLVAGKLSLIKAIGVGVAIDGIVKSVDDLRKYKDDPSLQNLGKTISDIGEAVVGVGVATGNLPVIAGGALVYLTGKFVENWDEIRNTTQKGIDFLREKSPEIEKIFGDTGKHVYDDVVDNCQDILDTADKTMKAFNYTIYDTMSLFDALAEGDWKKAWTKFKNIFSNIWESISEMIRTKVNMIIRFVNFLIEQVEKYINKMIDGFNELGANLQHVNLGGIPTLEKQNVVYTSAMEQFGISGPIKEKSFTDNLGDIANTISENISNSQIVIKFEENASQLIRALNPTIKEENNRVGTKIIQEGGM